MDDIEWGSPETAGLSERMAYRLAQFMKANSNPHLANRDRVPLMLLIQAGLGERTNKCPAWMPVDLDGYDDDWKRWTRDEMETLRNRLRANISRKVLYKVFNVPEHVAEEVEQSEFGYVMETVDVGAPVEEYRLLHNVSDTPLLESEEFNDGVFTMLDIKDTDERRFANRRYLEYAVSVDVTKPANQTLIKVVVINELQLQKTTRDLNDTDAAVRKAAMAALPNLHTQFSRAAESLALLEKQFKTEPEQESLDAVIIRTHDIRLDWYDGLIEREMGLHHLFDLSEKMHKTNVGDDDEIETVNIPQPVPQKTGKNVTAAVALSRLKASDGNAEMVIKGTESE